MGIDVLSRGSDGYEENRGAFNVLLSQEPAAIVTPASAGDVVDAIAYAKAEGLRIGAQRTGHSAEPLGDLSDTAAGPHRGAERGLDRRRAPHRPGRLRRPLGRPRPAGLRARAGRLPRLLADGRDRRLQPRRRGRLVRPQARPPVQPGDRDRAGRRRGDRTSGRRRQRPGALLGDARRGRRLRHRHRARVRAAADPRGLRRGALLPGRAGREVLHAWHEFTATRARGGHLGRPDDELPADARDPRADARQLVRDRRGGRAAAARPRRPRLLAPLRELGPAMDTFAVQPPAGIAGLHMDPPEPGALRGRRDAARRAAGRGDRRLLGAVGPDSGLATALGRDPPRRRRDGPRAAAGHGAMDSPARRVPAVRRRHRPRAGGDGADQSLARRDGRTR